MTKKPTDPKTTDRQAGDGGAERKTQGMRDDYSQNTAGNGKQAGSKSGSNWVVVRRRNVPTMEDKTGIRNDSKSAEEKLKAASARAARALMADRVEDVQEFTKPVKLPAQPESPVLARAPKNVTEPQPYVLQHPTSTDTQVVATERTNQVVAQIEPPVDMWKSLQRVPMGAQLGGRRARRSVPSLIEYFRADPIAKGFDLLRTRLVRTIRAYGWRRIAVVSPTQGCGTTFTAVNLALSLSRVPGSRTILMDLNQRTPGVADALGLRSNHSVTQFLSAEVGLQDYLQRPSPTLAIGVTTGPCSYAAELLHDPLTGEVLDDMIEALEPDLVIYDLPPKLEYDDLAAFLPQVDGVLLIADGTKTVPAHIAACERLLEGQCQLLGVVLNRGRAAGQGEVVV